MKILLVTNRVKTYSLAYQLMLESIHELGHELVWAADFSGFIGDVSQIPCNTCNIDIVTNPLKFRNIRAYHQILKIIDEYNINALLCNTPIGGTLGRLAAKKKNIKTVVYAAHGFLFFKGAPFINLTLYKWVEEWLARYTDTLITITEEDYEAAKHFKLRGNRAPYLIHGAGIKLGTTVSIDRIVKRENLGIPKDAFVIISAGDLNKNKNTEVMVKALAELNNKNVHYIACGVGPEEGNLKQLASKLGIEDRFHLLGYRTDVPELLFASDAFVMMSFREGLPRSVMEAMDLGLPCVGSDTRGVRDLIDEGKGGFICNPRKPKEFALAINKLIDSPEICISFGAYNKKKVQPYSCEIVKSELYSIYRESFVD